MSVPLRWRPSRRSPSSRWPDPELARLPQTIRGFGHVKEAKLRATRIRQDYLLEQLKAPVVAGNSVQAATEALARPIG